MEKIEQLKGELSTALAKDLSKPENQQAVYEAAKALREAGQPVSVDMNSKKATYLEA